MTFNEYDIVALTEEIQAIHKVTHQPILLRSPQYPKVSYCLPNIVLPVLPDHSKDSVMSVQYDAEADILMFTTKCA
jgi:hypothetical protein